MNQLLGTYKNGNFTVRIYNDGTKIRENQEDTFEPEFAENMDIKICDRCNMGCPMCHEGSTKDGKLGDIMNAKFVDTLKPYQEVALGGGNVLEHPDLLPFLKKLREKKVIANITLHQYHFEENQELIRMLVKERLVYGIGVSLANATDDFISLIKEYPNAVIHIINGIVKSSDLKNLCGHNLKILILGYKKLRRGTEYFTEEEDLIEKRSEWLHYHLADMIEDFDVVSFDNLAIEQLNVKRLLSKEEWDQFYMGDDGNFTYYIDMVNEQFAKSSTAPFDKRYDLLDDVVDMFKIIKNEK